MMTKSERENALMEIKKNHPDAIFTTKELAEYLKFCGATIKSYGYLGMPRLAKNKWYVPEVIFWLQYGLPEIKERKKYELHT